MSVRYRRRWQDDPRVHDDVAARRDGASLQQRRHQNGELQEEDLLQRSRPDSDAWKTHAVLSLCLEPGGGDLLGTLSKTRPRAAARTQSKFTSGLVAAIGASQDGVARLALPAWAEKQQSREDDRFARKKHRRRHGAC